MPSKNLLRFSIESVKGLELLARQLIQPANAKQDEPLTTPKKRHPPNQLQLTPTKREPTADHLSVENFNK